jgi:hypothetical protein
MEFGKNLLEKAVVKDERANIAAYMLSLIFGIILSVGVALPITVATVATLQTNDTIVTLVVGFIPVFVALLPLAMVAGYYRMMGG